MFAVELIGIAVLREFNILITALLLAGRSASSFAAEIGSMKMNQEIDAMQVLGVDPFDALVFPRFLALLLTIPLLTFVATLAGLAGRSGGEPGRRWASDRRSSSSGSSTTSASTTSGSACPRRRSWRWSSPASAAGRAWKSAATSSRLGRRVTAAVVHAIFAAILIDAIFALIYMELNI